MRNWERTRSAYVITVVILTWVQVLVHWLGVIGVEVRVSGIQLSFTNSFFSEFGHLWSHKYFTQVRTRVACSLWQAILWLCRVDATRNFGWKNRGRYQLHRKYVCLESWPSFMLSICCQRFWHLGADQPNNACPTFAAGSNDGSSDVRRREILLLLKGRTVKDDMCENDDWKISWFHFRCLKITRAPKGDWFCPDCRN